LRPVMSVIAPALMRLSESKAKTDVATSFSAAKCRISTCLLDIVVSVYQAKVQPGLQICRKTGYLFGSKSIIALASLLSSKLHTPDAACTVPTHENNATSKPN